MKRKLILVDGHNLLFRMYYGIPNSIKRNGIEIKGVLGFVATILKLYQQYSPYSMIVIFDSETSQTENKKIDVNYKCNRIDYKEVPAEENPFSQLGHIKKCLDFMSIPHFESIDNEADDFIASIAEKWQQDYQIIIVSTDKDFIQLVNDDVFLLVCRGKQSVLYDRKKVYEKYQVLPSQFVLYLSLVGDRADNISGIKGIGPKTALKLIQRDEQAFFQQQEALLRSQRKLITLNKKLPLPVIEVKQLSLDTLKTNDIINAVL